MNIGWIYKINSESSTILIVMKTRKIDELKALYLLTKTTIHRGYLREDDSR